MIEDLEPFIEQGMEFLRKYGLYIAAGMVVALVFILRAVFRGS